MWSARSVAEGASSDGGDAAGVAAAIVGLAAAPQA